MKSLALLPILVLATPVVYAEEPVDRTSIQTAVSRSVEWLERDMVTWRSTKGCAACHHGPMYLWSMHVARRQGYAVNEPQLQEMTQWLLTNDKARIFPRPSVATAELARSDDSADRMTTAMMGHNNLSQPTLYLAHALNAMPADEPMRQIGWQKITEHWAAAQMDDGSFAGRRGWPPIFNTPQIHTLYAAVALADTDAQTAELLARASRFLDRQSPDETHQGVVLRLLRETHRADANPTQQAPGSPQTESPESRAPGAPIPGSQELRSHLIESLRQQQRPDGGWAQTPDRDSDALATGQSLYVLKLAGIHSGDPAVDRGLAFLVHTQQADGTWPITSRPNPETGKPASWLNPITYAGTAWGTLGLMSHVGR